MIKADRLSSWIFIGTFILLVPSVKLLKFTDELTALLLMGVAVFDSIANGNWKKYKCLWSICGIMAFYALYSLTVMNNNTPYAITVDALIQLKPFVPFFVIMALGIHFTPSDKLILKIFAVVNCVIVAFITLFFRESVDDIIQHVSYIGIIAFVSALVYLYCSIDNDGNLDKGHLLTGLCMMSIGLLGTRAKFYATFILAVFFLIFYRPGISRQSLIKLAAVAGFVMLCIIAVAWKKFEYYFITGNSGRFDPEVMEAFARPILYATGFLILIHYFPFGSGLASFASYASGEISYSGIYSEYGINHVYGLSKQYPAFICDAFYPSLAQFGIAGICLFIYFWIYIAKKLKSLVRINPERNRLYFALGWIIIFFILIESVASTIFVQSGGQCAMMILGAICSTVKIHSRIETKKNDKPIYSFSYLNTQEICQNPIQ